MDLPESKGIWHKRFEDLRQRLLRREVAVFSFFLVLSFIFWFLNALSKEMTGRIDYPVRYFNFPEDRALVNELPDYLSLQVNGPGYSIVQTKLGGSRDHLNIDLDKSSIKIQEDRDKLRFYILSYSLREQLSDQLRTDFSILSIVPDTLHFEFDLISEKMVPVIPDIDVSAQRQYFVHGDIRCSPDSVKISGPSTIVDTIKAVYTKYYNFNQLNETESKVLGLKSISKISFSDRRTEVIIPVEQYTEAIIEIPVIGMSIPDSLSIRFFPDKVTLQCIVALSDYNKINDAPIKAVIDFKDHDIMASNRLKPSLDKLPDFASQVRINPQYVEYLIERK